MLHVGTAPYRDAHTGVAGFRRLIARFPRLWACVAHMGAFETDAFLDLLGNHPNVHLDTTMALAPAALPFVGIDGAAFPMARILEHQDRIVFGSDDPLIPYDHDEERRWAHDRGLPLDVQRKIFHENPARFLGLGGHGGRDLWSPGPAGAGSAETRSHDGVVGPGGRERRRARR